MPSTNVSTKYQLYHGHGSRPLDASVAVSDTITVSYIPKITCLLRAWQKKAVSHILDPCARQLMRETCLRLPIKPQRDTIAHSPPGAKRKA